MNPFRKLLVLAVNELVSKNYISLELEDKTQDSHLIKDTPPGYLLTEIAGEPAAINWNGIGHGELRISVWWKYMHELHPDKEYERFEVQRPFTHRRHYPNFVGVTCSAWFERFTGKYIQGYGNKKIFDTYMRRGEKRNLERLPNPTANGFDSEGKWFL